MRRSLSANKRKRKLIKSIFAILAIIVVTVLVAQRANGSKNNDLVNLSYNGEIAIELNNNVPPFNTADLKKAQKGYESYSKLDTLGRCGVAEASVCLDTMPDDGEKRTSLGSINPSGWQSINFWCRCHLIGWQLTAENANEKNLITGTTRMNMSGMLPYENCIANYLEEHPDDHVLYRVEPLFDGDNLIASGVCLQAESVEDKGKGVCFNVYVFNYQPGFIINYNNGMVFDDPEHQTVITLSDKKAKYTGEPIKIDEANIDGSSGSTNYIYYTDINAKIKTTEKEGALDRGSAPTNRGTYYVRAVVSGDNWFPTAVSNIAKLEIN